MTYCITTQAVLLLLMEFLIAFIYFAHTFTTLRDDISHLEKWLQCVLACSLQDKILRKSNCAWTICIPVRCSRTACGIWEFHNWYPTKCHMHGQVKHGCWHQFSVCMLLSPAQSFTSVESLFLTSHHQPTVETAGVNKKAGYQSTKTALFTLLYVLTSNYVKIRIIIHIWHTQQSWDRIAAEVFPDVLMLLIYKIFK